MTDGDQDRPYRQVRIERVTSTTRDPLDDCVATEEPLEIRVVAGPAERRRSRSLAITMRTPGTDAELALGFLCSEGVIRTAADVVRIDHVGPAQADGRAHQSVTGGVKQQRYSDPVL